MRRIILVLFLLLVPGLAFAANLQTVTLTAGVPTSGTGTVSTLDAILGSGPKTLTDLATAIAATNTALGTPMQASGGSVTANAGTNLNTSALGTAANQSTANGYLSTIATNSGLAIPAGTNPIGYLTGQYPGGATPITGNSTGTTGAVVGTLAGASAKTTYICGFDVSAIGGTAAVGPITVAGLVGSSAVYELASTTTGITLSREYNPCIPASSTNTAITITTTADGTASAVAVNSHGFQL